MRMFFNAIYDLGKPKQQFSQILPAVRRIMEENRWSSLRLLFHFDDINDASKESQTTHQKMINTFPQMKPYWQSSFNWHMSRRSSAKESPHQFSFFSNFPGRANGRPVFAPEDEALTEDLLEEICGKIPRPYSLYSAVVILDGINWYGDSDLSPAMHWDVCRNKEDQDWLPGHWPGGLALFETVPFYQCNGVVFSKDFETSPELDIRIELTASHDINAARKIAQQFAAVFGPPTKQCVRAIHPWGEREAYRARIREMQEFYTVWINKLKMEIRGKQERLNPITFSTEKHLSRKTRQKQFLKVNGLDRHALRRWDDYGWCKVLDHHYCLHIDLDINPEAKDAGSPRQRTNAIGLVCYGSNFTLRSGISVEDFPAPEGDPAGVFAFSCFQLFLDRFVSEVVPKLAAIFGDTPKEFAQDSYAMNISYDNEDVIL